MTAYNDLYATMAMTHANDLLREAEQLRLIHEAQKCEQIVQNRMLYGIGEVLVSSGQWLKDHSKKPHSLN